MFSHFHRNAFFSLIVLWVMRIIANISAGIVPPPALEVTTQSHHFKGKLAYRYKATLNLDINR